jgi:methoxymalonate biosynthesis acyl carrier protein
MELDQTKHELRNFIREHFKVPDADHDFTDDVHLFDYGYIDSFGAVELTSFLEKHYAIEVKDTDLIAYPLNTIQEISAFVVKRKNGEL